MNEIKRQYNRGNMLRELGIDSMEQTERKSFINFTEQDIHILKELYPVIKEHADDIVDAFYQNIKKSGHLLAIIDNAGSSVDKLSATQKSYLLQLFEGNYDADYFERRLVIGVIHNDIGLSPRWYLGSYCIYVQQIIPLIRKKFRFRPKKRERAILALNKIISLDSQLAIDTYIYSLTNDIKDITLSKSQIEERVKDYKEFIEKVASGDLSDRLEISGDDDLSRLGSYLNSMTDSLSEMVAETMEATTTVASMVQELQSAVGSQSSAASQQASSIQETSTSLEEMKATSHQTLEKATTVSNASSQTREEGENGLDMVQQIINGMKVIRKKVTTIAENILALSEQTQQIGEITNTVNMLSQQLKMLGLNASIEATKAGEAGQGFAVVAGEVKELAEQSQQATTQVQKILEAIQHATDKAVMVTEEGSKGVSEGVELVEQTGEAVRNLTEVINDSSIASQQIVAAVRQENAGIEQVAQAMTEINEATSQVVTATNQSKEAATELADTAQKLKEKVSVYSL